MEKHPPHTAIKRDEILFDGSSTPTYMDVVLLICCLFDMVAVQSFYAQIGTKIISVEKGKFTEAWNLFFKMKIDLKTGGRCFLHFNVQFQYVHHFIHKITCMFSVEYSSLESAPRPFRHM